MPVDPQVLAEAGRWVLDGHGGYKSASKRFNVPRTTLQRYVHQVRAGEKPPPPAAPARARATPDLVAPTFDPATASQVEFLEHRVRHYDAMAMRLELESNLKSAREWRALERASKKELEEARKANAAAEERRKAAEVRNPRELAVKLLDQITALCWLEPEKAAEVYEAMGRALGKVEIEDDYTPSDEPQPEGADEQRRCEA